MCFAHRAIPPRPEGRGFPRNRMKALARKFPSRLFSLQKQV